MNRQTLHVVLVAISLSNFCFIRAWTQLGKLDNRGYDFFRDSPRDPTYLISTISSVLILAASLLGVAWVIRLINRPALNAAGDCAFLLLALFPLELCRRYADFSGTPRWKAAAMVVLLGQIALLAGAAWRLFRPNQLAPRLVGGMFLVASPVFFVLVASMLWTLARQPSASLFKDRPLAARQALRPGGARVLWIVLDELDQRLAFDERPASVALPQLDRLRREALYASSAYPTGNLTQVAMPSLISGKRFTRSEPRSVDELQVFPDGGDWRACPNIFARARALGHNTALVGWHLPYCRILNESLSFCHSDPAMETDALRKENYGQVKGLARTILATAEAQVQGLPLFSSAATFEQSVTEDEFRVSRDLHQKRFLRFRENALRAIAQPDLDFVLLHCPIPHPPGVYNRHRGDFALDDSESYLDNLVLADRTLGELRSAMERAGLWDKTIVLVTSDHPYRPDVWRAGLFFTREVAELVQAESPKVPFLLKFEGQRQGLNYDQPFNTLLTHDLLLALLSKDIAGPEPAVRWLDAHRSSVPLTLP